jgi:hypothetical protein
MSPVSPLTIRWDGFRSTRLSDSDPYGLYTKQPKEQNYLLTSEECGQATHPCHKRKYIAPKDAMTALNSEKEEHPDEH